SRRTARRLGIPYYVVDLRERFEQSVIGAFTATYLAGRTPNPCTLCNRDVKFDALWEYAAALGAAALATRHYAPIGGTAADGFTPREAASCDKDQSYFLFTLGQPELARTLFPVGALCKPEVRAIAAALELPVADKRESQDICFVAGRSYADFVADRSSPAERR